MKKKNVKDELWVLYEKAKEGSDFRLALDILDRIRCYPKSSLEDDRRK